MAAILGAILDMGRPQVFLLVLVCFNLSEYVFYWIPCVSKHIFRHLKCLLGLPSCKVMKKQEMAAILGAILDSERAQTVLLVLV